MCTGMVVGLIIKYSGGVSQRGYNTSCVINTTEAKQVIWVSSNANWYSYRLSGVVRPSKSAVGNDFEQKVCLMNLESLLVFISFKNLILSGTAGFLTIITELSLSIGNQRYCWPFEHFCQLESGRDKQKKPAVITKILWKK